MAYEIGAGEAVPEGVRRAAAEELENALYELTDGVAQDPAEALHSARKSIKKARSLLRLASGTMAPEQRRRENALLRRAARRLSARRDAEVMTATVGALSERFAGQAEATAFDAVRQHLAIHRPAEDGSGVDRRAVEELQAAREHVDGWRLDRGGWKALEPGASRSYERGRRAFTRVRGQAAPEEWHAWRKRVKDLWYHQRLLGATGGPAVRGQAKDAHRLADLLGDEHDLTVLHETLTSTVLPVPVYVDTVVGLIERRRAELREEALELGARVYAESPRAYRRRMRRAWRAGRRLADVRSGAGSAELAAAAR